MSVQNLAKAMDRKRKVLHFSRQMASNLITGGIPRPLTEEMESFVLGALTLGRLAPTASLRLENRGSFFVTIVVKP